MLKFMPEISLSLFSCNGSVLTTNLQCRAGGQFHITSVFVLVYVHVTHMKSGELQDIAGN